MKLSDAFRKSIKAYFEGSEYENFDKAVGKERKYTKAYFDMIEEEFGLSDIKAKDEDKD